MQERYMQGNIERGGRQTVLNREGGGKHFMFEAVVAMIMLMKRWM